MIRKVFPRRYLSFPLISALRSCTMSSTEVFLKDREAFYPVKLQLKTVVNHDTHLFRFALPSPQLALGVPVGHHVGVSATLGGERVERWYTPLTSDLDLGYFELVIKIYGPCEEHPEGGRLTQHLDKLQPGDEVFLRGPRGRLEYLGRGSYLICPDKDTDPEPVNADRVAMIAGGSGLAPMLQLMRSVTRDPEDKTEMLLLFANQTEEDIMMREEIEQLARDFPTKVKKVWYTLDRPPPDWSYSVGHVTEEMLKEHTFAPGEDTLMLMCGRKAMIRGLVWPLLDKLGHPEVRIFKY